MAQYIEKLKSFKKLTFKNVYSNFRNKTLNTIHVRQKILKLTTDISRAHYKLKHTRTNIRVPNLLAFKPKKKKEQPYLKRCKMLGGTKF